jgi:hypothetical protein
LREHIDQPSLNGPVVGAIRGRAARCVVANNPRAPGDSMRFRDVDSWSCCAVVITFACLWRRRIFRDVDVVAMRGREDVIHFSRRSLRDVDAS